MSFTPSNALKMPTTVIIGINFLLRCVMAGFFIAYTHPDMLFQSQEIAARDILGLNVVPPWEFEPNKACRSALQPILLGYIPFYILKLLHFHNNKWALIVLPRIYMACLSLIGDAAFSRIASKHFFRDSSRMLLLYLGSGAVMSYSIATFSNTLELILLLVCMWLVEENRHISLGVCITLGTWIRFTFPLFIVPFALIRLSKNFSLSKAVKIALSGLVSVTLLIWLDSWYFGEIVVTPLNSFLFNIKPENVKQFGVTPYHLHLTGNGPFLFGPLFLCFFLSAFQLPEKTNFQVGCFASSIISFVALSTSSHQEWRFLLPLAPLLIFTVGPQIVYNRVFISTNVCHYLLLIIALGAAEKTLPAMITINQMNPPPSKIYVYQVIPIPKMLLPANAHIIETTHLNFKAAKSSDTILLSSQQINVLQPTIIFWPHVNLLNLSQEWNLYIYPVE